jgi:pilus assembly protein Flp/PilA
MFRFYAFSRSFRGHSLGRDDRGATAVEYSLIIGLIAAVIVGAVTAFGLGVQNLFNTIPPGF